MRRESKPQAAGEGNSALARIFSGGQDGRSGDIGFPLSCFPDRRPRAPGPDSLLQREPQQPRSDTGERGLEARRAGERT